MIEESPLSTLRISIVDMMKLQVRARRPGHSAPPEYLYQELPTEAISIIGTIPRGAFAVSIPQQNALGCGYRILRKPPPSNGFVIVYARRPNNRYEAAGVIDGGKTLSFNEFQEEACRWIREHRGLLNPLPGRYAYFAPSRDHWAVILRDNGYTVSDSLAAPDTITHELRDYGKNLKGELLARVPVYDGEGGPQGATLPVFAQVELTLDAHPGSGSPWIGFVEYQKKRNIRSRPPDSIVSDFLEWLALLSSECGFKRWIFRPGMFFGDRVEWWGDCNRRRTVHEGADFVEGLQSDEKIRNIPEWTPVCAMADGEIVAILDDFLGKTVVVRHPAIAHESGDAFYTFVSHIRPDSDRLGPIAKGRLLGKVNKSASAGAPPHLHLTGAWIPQAVPPGAITLDHLHPANTSVVLVNFNELIQGSPLCITETSSNA